MQTDNKYNTDLLHITVSLNQEGFNILCNTVKYCKKQRLGKVYFESTYKEKITERELINCTLRKGQESYYCFSYWQIVFPENKEKSIEFLKAKILEEITGWKICIERMINSTPK